MPCTRAQIGSQPADIAPSSYPDVRLTADQVLKERVEPRDGVLATRRSFLTCSNAGAVLKVAVVAIHIGQR